MLKYGNKDLRKRWIGNVNIANIHLGTTKIWPYITSTSVGDWVVTATPSKTTVSAAGETITITVTGKRTTTYTWVNFIGTTTKRYTTTADETISNYTISSSIGTVNGNKVTIPYNPNTSDRNITITVNVSGQTVTKTIVQTKNVVTYSAWQLSASSNVSSVASGGGTVTITASSWRTYTNSNGQPGGTQNGTISYSPSVGSMNGNVWTIPANSSTSSRNVKVTVTGSGNITKVITISQAANVKTVTAIKFLHTDMSTSTSDKPYYTGLSYNGGQRTLVGYLAVYINGALSPNVSFDDFVIYSTDDADSDNNKQIYLIGGLVTEVNQALVEVSTKNSDNLFPIYITPVNEDAYLDNQLYSLWAKSADGTKEAYTGVVRIPQEAGYVLNIERKSLYGQNTALTDINIWFEDTVNGTKYPIDNLTVNTGKIYSLEEDSTQLNTSKFTWHGLANVSNTSKTITFTATNNELGITESIDYVHDVPSTNASTNWYLHCSNINGQSLTEDVLVTKIIAMKSGVVPQNGQMQTKALTSAVTGASYIHTTSLSFTNEGMTVNGSANSTNLVKAANGETIDFYKRNGDVAASCTYTKIGSMIVDVTKSKTLDCITGKVYPDNFV